MDGIGNGLNIVPFSGFSTGIFFLHEMPDVNLIHTLSISEHRISSIAMSSPGDWIAFGCPAIGQLLVWEWQSKYRSMTFLIINLIRPTAGHESPRCPKADLTPSHFAL